MHGNALSRILQVTFEANSEFSCEAHCQKSNAGVTRVDHDFVLCT